MNKCEYCGKELKRKIFCSNSHKVMYYRKGTVCKKEVAIPIQVPSIPSKPQIALEQKSVFEYCYKYHPGKKFVLKLCKRESIDGDILWERRLCPDCIKSEASDSKRNGGPFYVEGVRYENK